MEGHPGLIFKARKDHAKYFGQPDQKEMLLERLVDAGVDPVYALALKRWRQSMAPGDGFADDGCLAKGPGRAVARGDLKVLSRLVTGLGDRGAFEWGVRLHHTYGMPVIPGSSLKGAVAGHLDESLPEEQRAPTRSLLFGDTDAGGTLVFHDAWWVPTKEAPRPFVRDVMTPHHLDYGTKDSAPPADWDDPTPVGFVAVTGAFFFAVEATSEDLARLGWDLLVATLTRRGVGAKTRAGYGLFQAG